MDNGFLRLKQVRVPRWKNVIFNNRIFNAGARMMFFFFNFECNSFHHVMILPGQTCPCNLTNLTVTESTHEIQRMLNWPT